jgi:hypothetical protein
VVVSLINTLTGTECDACGYDTVMCASIFWLSWSLCNH